MNYKEVIKNKNKDIATTRTAIITNKVMLRDSSVALGSLKSAIREANRKGDGAVVSRLTKELNVRRSLVSAVEKVQTNNRQILRELYILRKGLIADWVEKES